MRAMILAAGAGTRMRPLSNLRAKPALPVLGFPVIVTLLEFLKTHGVGEALINVHHRAESIRAFSVCMPLAFGLSWKEFESV